MTSGDIKLRSEITKDKYISLKEKDASVYGSLNTIDVISEDDSDDITSEKTDDGYTVKFGKLKGGAFDAFSKLLSGEADFGGITLSVKSIALTLAVDKDFLPASLDFAVVFENEDYTFNMSINAKVVHWDETEKPSVEGISDFTKVDDVFAVQKAIDGVSSLRSSKSGSFTSVSTQKVSTATAKTEFSETDKVTFKTEGGYTYDIDAEIKQDKTTTKAKMSYKDGKQTVTAGSQNSTSDVTELQAQQTVLGLIDGGSLDLGNTSGVEISSEGSLTNVKFTVKDVPHDKYDVIFQGSGYKVISEEASITVTLDGDGKVTKYVYALSANFQAMATNCHVDLSIDSDFAGMYTDEQSESEVSPKADV